MYKKIKSIIAKKFPMVWKNLRWFKSSKWYLESLSPSIDSNYLNNINESRTNDPVLITHISPVVCDDKNITRDDEVTKILEELYEYKGGKSHF